MKLPPKNASAYEIAEFLEEYNLQIHNAIIEGKEYRSLIEDLVDANISEIYENFRTAIASLHLSKIRFYAGTRDVTNEINYIKDNVEIPGNEFNSSIYDINIDKNNDMLAVIDHINNSGNGEAIIDYLFMIDTLFDFQFDENNFAETLNNFKMYIKEMETEYFSTVSVYHLSLQFLNAKEKRILKYSEDSNEVISILTKLIIRWEENKKIEIKTGKETERKTLLDITVKGKTGYSINSLLENIGVYRKQYNRFLNEETTPSRMLVLAMALYLMPNDYISIEKFMNIFGYSINSDIMYVAHRDIEPNKKIYMYDRDVRKLLCSGLDTEIIVMLLAEKNNVVKKSASSRHFS